MPETPKRSVDEPKADNGSVAEDQKSHGYYYDDAYGYQDYRPEDDVENEDDECNDAKST